MFVENENFKITFQENQLKTIMSKRKTMTVATTPTHVKSRGNLILDKLNQSLDKLNKKSIDKLH